MSLIATTHQLVSVVPPPFWSQELFRPTCPADRVLTVYEKDFKSITPKDQRTVKKIEIFNSQIQEWGEIPVKIFNFLMKIGLTEERLEKLNDAWGKLDKRDSMPFGDFIMLLIGYVDVMSESQDQKPIEFWNLVESLTDRDINDLVLENKCLIRGEDREHALILETFAPEDPAFFRNGIFNMHFMRTLSKAMNVCSRTFSSFAELCSTAVNMTKTFTTKIIMIKGHGIKPPGYGIQTYPDPQKSVTVFDRFHDCFNHIAKGGTIILNACGAGWGRHAEHNIANHIANNVPPGTHVIAPTEDMAVMTFNPKEPAPHSTIFRNREHVMTGVSQSVPSTYHIDTGNPDFRLCPRDEISLLDFCTKFPLFQLKRSINIEDPPILYFQSMFYQGWYRVSHSTWSFFVERSFNNKQLERISQSSLLPSKFVEMAEKYSPEFTADDLMNLILGR